MDQKIGGYMKKFLLGFFTTALLTQGAFAACENAYTDRIKALDARMNPARGVMIANVSGAVIAQSIIYGINGAISIVGAVGVPAIAVGAGGYYGALLVSRARYRTSLHIIKEANSGVRGEDLENFIKRINRRNKTEVDTNQVIDSIKNGNNLNAFCEVDYDTDKADLMYPNKLVKYVENDLGLN